MPWHEPGTVPMLQEPCVCLQVTPFLDVGAALARAGVGLSVWNWRSCPRLEDVMSLLLLGCAHCAQVVSQLASVKMCFCVCATNMLPVLTTKEIAVGYHCWFS